MTSFSHHFLTLASKMNRRGHWVLLETAKSGKKSSKTAKNSIKTKTACKTVHTDKFWHPSYQNPLRSDTVSDKCNLQRFRDYSRSVEAHNWHSHWGKTRTEMGKTVNHIGYQISESHYVFFFSFSFFFSTENRKPNPKKRNTDLKNSQNR